MIHACLITGPPGSGKTTLLKEVVAAFSGKAGGFYTEEIRSQGASLSQRSEDSVSESLPKGIRHGFQIVTLAGERAILSHVNLPGPPRVGRYGVDIAALEQTGVTALRRAIHEDDLIVVDEIGKMELFSPGFREALREALDSGKRVLGTIMQAPHPWAHEIKRLPQVRLLALTRENREQMKGEIIRWLLV